MLFKDMYQVLDGCCEQLARFQFEINSGSVQGCKGLLHICQMSFGVLWEDDNVVDVD